ncbi:MAG: hypothetical protein QOG59_208, partial [Solirubrobacteraceae bacterium]|nr:hypothetical protein [Solirubrobacteraceae bacterium]
MGYRSPVLFLLTGPTPPAVKRAAQALGIEASLKRFKAALRPAQDGLAQQLGLVVAVLPARRLRHAVYRVMGMRIAPTAVVHRGLEVRSPGRIVIGEDSVVGFDVILDGRGHIELGAHVNVSSEVAIWTVQHDPRAPDFGVFGAPVRVEDYAWLSFRATVLPGVSIGEGAVVAAGAVVTRDVPAYSIVAGVPARVVGERPRPLSYEINAR